MGVQLRTRVALALVVTTSLCASTACGAVPSKAGSALPPVTLDSVELQRARSPARRPAR